MTEEITEGSNNTFLYDPKYYSVCTNPDCKKIVRSAEAKGWFICTTLDFKGEIFGIYFCHECFCKFKTSKIDQTILNENLIKRADRHLLLFKLKNFIRKIF